MRPISLPYPTVVPVSVRLEYRRAAVEEESEFEFFMPLRSFLHRTAPAADMSPVHAFVPVRACALHCIRYLLGTERSAELGSVPRPVRMLVVPVFVL